LFPVCRRRHFHPVEVFEKTGKPVFIAHPESGSIHPLQAEDIEKRKAHTKAALANFLSKENIAILISTKDGQRNIKAAQQLRKRFKDKRFYLLAFDTLDFSQLLNFPFIDVFVNTACPRLMDDYDKFPRPLINLQDI